MDNCGKIINIGMGCCEPVLGPVYNYYTKTQVDRLIENIDVSGITSGEVESMIDEATSGMATQEWVQEQGYLTEHQSLSDYATEQWVENKNYITGVDLSNYDTKSEVDDKISSAVTEVNNVLTGHTNNNSIHVTTAQTAAWDAKSNFSGSYNDLADKPTIPTIWSGTEQQWSQISGGTLDNNTIYLVY